MRRRFTRKITAILICLFLCQMHAIPPSYSQSRLTAKPGNKLVVSSGLRKATVKVHADCAGIYDKKLNRLKRKLENERKHTEEDFARQKQAIEKQRKELIARYKALGNIFDPASSLRHKCDTFGDKIGKYNFEMGFARRTMDVTSEEYDKKVALLQDAIKKTFKQWKDCNAKLEAKLKEAGTFKQRLEKEDRALSKAVDAKTRVDALEQEKKKTLDRLSKDYERRKGWLQESRNYCKKTGEWPVETASCLSKSCAGNFKDAFQALQHTLQTKRKLKKQLLKMQRRLDRQWDKVAVEMRDKMMSLEGSVGIVTVKAMGNFLFAFGLDRVDDFIGLQVEKGTAKYFPAGDEGKKVLQKIVGTGMRKGVQKITIEGIKKLPSKTNAILGGLKKLDQSEEEAGAYRVSDKQPPPEDIAKGIAERIPGGLKDALLGRYPILIAGDVLGPNQVRLSPIKLSEFKEKFPSIAALDETYGKIFKLLKQLSALSAEEEGLWRKLINISSCIKPQCNLIPAATQKLDIGITQKDLDRARKHAFGERHGPLYSQRSKIQRLKMVARGFECDLCKALQILKEVREVSDITRANIKTLNTLIMHNQKTILSLNLDLYKILTRPGALKGALWGYYDYLSTAMTFLPNGGAAVAFAEGIVSVADQYMKEGSRPAHDTWANIKRVSVFQASNAWLLDKWTRFGNSLNAFQEDIIRRILANCLDDICSEEKAPQAPAPPKETVSETPASDQGREPVTDIVDISGCWFRGHERDTFITQTGRNVVATLIYEDGQDNKIKVVYTGTFNPPYLDLVLQTKIPAAWREIVETRIHMTGHAVYNYDGMNRGKKFLQGVYFEGIWQSLIDTASGGEVRMAQERALGMYVVSIDVTDSSFTKSYTKTLEDVRVGERFWIKAKIAENAGCPEMREKFEVTVKAEEYLNFRNHLNPQDYLNDRILVMLTETGPDTGEFHSPPEGLKVKAKPGDKLIIGTREMYPKRASVTVADNLKLFDLMVTDRSYTKNISDIEPGDLIWIKTKAHNGRTGVEDTVRVFVYPQGEESKGIEVKLTETGPNTLEFRSPAEGVLVASVFEKEEKQAVKNKKEAKEKLESKKEAGTEKSKKAEKGIAKGGKKAVSGHKEKQEIIEVGAQGGKKKAGFKTALNRNKVKLINDKKWLEKELKNRKETLNNLGQARILFIRHYINSEGKEISRLETTENPELSEQGFKLDKTESVLFMRKAKEHLNKEIGKIQTDLKRIMKELEGLR